MSDWRRAVEPETRGTSESGAANRSSMRAGLVVSTQSSIWTVASSSVAIILGLRTHTSVLIAFGSIGFVDAIGSIALMYHFRHGLRHDALSEKLERLSHRIVLVGLLVVGCAAIIGGLARLAHEQANQASDAGVVLAAISLVGLLALSARKGSIARRVSSSALRSDGHLSAIGAMQAAVTLGGTAATRWADWQWADAAATMAVGCVAVMLAVATWIAEAQKRGRLRPGWSLPRAAFAAVSAVALVDTLLGRHLVLIGLLVAGPAIAAVSMQPRATRFVSAWSVALAVVLGAPDHIWLTPEHAVWIGAIAFVGLVNAAAVTIVARRRDAVRSLSSRRPG